MVSGVDVAADRLTLRFDEAVAGASAFLLDGPSRIAVDVGSGAVGPASQSLEFVLRTHIRHPLTCLRRWPQRAALATVCA